MSNVQIPSILTANTYFWTPSTNASDRRKNEEKKLNEVASFFETLGFEVSNTDRVIAKKDELEVVFSYSESCKNVYKHLSVTRNGKNSNITAIKKLIA